MLTLVLYWEVATLALGSRMSVLNQSGEEPVECPLCMEALEVDDLHFYPCTCGYQICRFCWNRIREGENGLCPACRKAYPEDPADFTPLSQEQVAAIKTEKKAREQKRRNKTLESRRALANVRVVQKNLVFVVGLPVRLADPEILKRQEYFGKYGKIHKVVINQNNTYAGAQPSGSQTPSASAYVTYLSSADALRAIQGVNNATLDGRVLKGSLGTTKYCANFMKNQPCPKPDCMYLHELGDPKASFTKEEMHAGLHQIYERKLHNQLLAATRDKLEQAEKQANGSGNSSTNGDKSNGKDGTPANFISTTVVTSSNINVVNSSKSKKEQNGVSNSNGNGFGSNGKEAWPSLGSSPPSDSPARKQSSPKPQSTVKSQENGTCSTSESSSPTELEPHTQTQTQPQPQPQAQKKTKDTQETKLRKESTNGKKKDKSKQKSSNSISVSTDPEVKPNSETKTNDSYKNSESNNISESFKTSNYKNSEFKKREFKKSEFKNSEFENSEFKNRNTESFKNSDYKNSDYKNSDYKSEEPKTTYSTTQTNNSSVFENESYLANELNELESDRHSLLENHDLLDNSDHSLLDDDNTHNLLNDANNEVMLMQRHREMLAGLVDNKHMLPQMKNPMLNGMNGYGLLERDMGYLDRLSQMNSQLEKDTLMRERSQSELLRRQNEMMGRQHNVMVEPKHYMPSPSIGMENASELLGANYHQNPNMLPPFGMRVDTSMGSMNSMGSSMSNINVNMNANLNASMSNMPGMANSLGFMHHQQMMNQQMPNGLVNGFDAQKTNEGRYQAETMDKFFTDFHKAQQLRLQLNRGPEADRRQPHNMLSAERLEMEHKQRLNAGREQGGRCAAGDGDDDLDFDPFKETQKAFAELMETEMIQNQVSSGDNIDRVRRTRMAPPGFTTQHVNSIGLGVPRHPSQHGFLNSTSTASFSDWTQMDPAIMAVNFSKNQPPPPPPTQTPTPTHQELFARFNQFNMPPNGMPKHPMPQWQTGKMPGWSAPQFNSIPLPPGFAPAKSAAHPAECIDAK